MKWLEPDWLWLLAALPVLGVLGAIGAGAGARALRRFFGAAARRPWARTRASGALRPLAAALALGAIACTALALARPANNPTPKTAQRPGRDLVFIIDVSRSMLAQDLRPSRLERAKLAARDVLDVVEGDRVGVLAFAGTAVVKCPLTTDYTFARMAIDGLSTESVSRGGTHIGDAIRTALSQLFAEALGPDAPPSSPRTRTLVIMTDGEDHESRPVDAAKEAGEKGVRIVTIGLGSDLAGAPLPAPPPTGRGGVRPPERHMEYQGQRVESRMNPSVLREVAESTPGGVFLNVGTGNVELDQVYKRLMRVGGAVEQLDQTALKYTEQFQWLLIGALALLGLEGVVRAVSR